MICSNNANMQVNLKTKLNGLLGSFVFSVWFIIWGCFLIHFEKIKGLQSGNSCTGETMVPRINQHLNVVEGFVCPSEPRSYDVGSNLPLVGSPVQIGDGWGAPPGARLREEVGWEHLCPLNSFFFFVVVVACFSHWSVSNHQTNLNSGQRWHKKTQNAVSKLLS